MAGEEASRLTDRAAEACGLRGHRSVNGNPAGYHVLGRARVPVLEGIYWLPRHASTLGPSGPEIQRAHRTQRLASTYRAAGRTVAWREAILRMRCRR
jgi:hypothetical protein